MWLSWFRSSINRLGTKQSYWGALSTSALRDDLDWQQKRLVVAIALKSKQINSTYTIESWKEEYASLITRWHKILHEIKEQPNTSFTIFFVAIRELLDLTQTCSQPLPELLEIK